VATVPADKAIKIEAKAAAKSVAAVKTAAAPKAAKMREVKPKAAPIAAPKGTKTMNDTVKQVEETVKKATAEAGEKATEMFKDMNTRAKAAFDKAGSFAKDAAEFNKANLEAFVESGKIAAKGAQTAAQNTAELVRKNFEATSTLVKTAAAVKSPTELFKLQGDFARSQFDGVVAEMSKSSEFYLKLVGEVFQPIQSRYAVVAEELKTRMAA
jgi:phasin family protein